jgi:hypothetical protein
MSGAAHKRQFLARACTSTYLVAVGRNESSELFAAIAIILCVDDQQLHILLEQLARVANVDGGLLLITGNHPNTNTGLQQNTCNKYQRTTQRQRTALPPTYTQQIVNRLRNFILQSVLNGSAANERQLRLQFRRDFFDLFVIW